MKGLNFVIITLAIIICSKLFLIDVYKIPSASMNDTLYTNDIVIVNKLLFGPKLPQSFSDIPGMNIMHYIFKTDDESAISPWFDTKRFSGLSKIRNGDIVVFKIPHKSQESLIKRCVGVPGDTLKISDGDVYINRSIFYPTDNIRFEYKFKDDKQTNYNEKLDSLEINSKLNRYSYDSLMLKVSDKNKKRLESLGVIKSLTKVLTLPYEIDEFFPNSKINDWSINDYGPYIIPYDGMSILMNNENFEHYGNTINSYEGTAVQKIGDEYFVDNERINKYVFKQNYYFMMGDNRNNSKDSRILGVVPESEIVGLVRYALYSEHGSLWRRFFKKLD